MLSVEPVSNTTIWSASGIGFYPAGYKLGFIFANSIDNDLHSVPPVVAVCRKIKEGGHGLRSLDEGRAICLRGNITQTGNVRAMALAWYPLPVGTTWRVVGPLETTEERRRTGGGIPAL